MERGAWQAIVHGVAKSLTSKVTKDTGIAPITEAAKLAEFLLLMCQCRSFQRWKLSP